MIKKAIISQLCGAVLLAGQFMMPQDAHAGGWFPIYVPECVQVKRWTPFGYEWVIWCG